MVAVGKEWKEQGSPTVKEEVVRLGDHLGCHQWGGAENPGWQVVSR